MTIKRTVRRTAALLTAADGVMNVVSALYPAIPARMELLRDVLPVHIIRSSQTLTVLVGFLLMILADGLWKRRKRAMQIAVGLLLLSSFLNLTKGLDYEEATAGFVLAFGLIQQRRAFDVSGHLPAPSHAVRRILTFLLLYYAYVLAGFFILRRAISPVPSIWSVSAEPVQLLLGNSNFHYASHQAQWFMRSLIVLGGAVVLYTLVQLLRPLLPHRPPTGAERELVRSLVRRYGGDALSYFSLQDGRSYFIDAGGEAFLSYRLSGTVALVGGDPIGNPARIPDLVASFLDFADANGIDVCLVGIDGRYQRLYHGLGFKTLKIGEEAVIDLPSFDVAALKRKVRRAARHSADLGISVASFRPGAVPSGIRAQMEEINRAWVEEKGGMEKGFSMTLGRLPGALDEDCEVVIAMEGTRVWGYLCMVPVYAGNGWSLDAMRRRADAPNGLTEFLVIQAAEMYRNRDYESLSLNFATLANSVDDIDSRMLESTRRFLFDNLSSFYQLKSLYSFNSKFHPRWNSRYMAYRGVLKFPKLAVAIVQSEDPVRLTSFVPLIRR